MKKIIFAVFVLSAQSALAGQSIICSGQDIKGNVTYGFDTETQELYEERYTRGRPNDISLPVKEVQSLQCAKCFDVKFNGF